MTDAQFLAKPALVAYWKNSVASAFVLATGVAQWQDQLEWGLRVTVALLGIAVAVLNIRSLLKKDKLVKETLSVANKV